MFESLCTIPQAANPPKFCSNHKYAKAMGYWSTGNYRYAVCGECFLMAMIASFNPVRYTEMRWEPKDSEIVWIPKATS